MIIISRRPVDSTAIRLVGWPPDVQCMPGADLSILSSQIILHCKRESPLK